VTDSRLTYRFGPLERRGLLGPVRAGQALLLGAGALVAVAALDAAPTPAGAAAGMIALLLAGAGATLPLAGRTLEQWAPVAAGFVVRLARRRVSFRSCVPTRGMLTTPGGRHAIADPAAAPPSALHDVAIVEVSYRDRRVGALSECKGRRLTAVLACRAPSFALLDPEAQERRLARWGLVLSCAAGTAIRRIQWVERTAPAPADELARWLHDARDPSLPLRGTPAIESYLELIGTGARVAHDHEILVAVQTDAGRGRDGRPAALAEALVEAAEQVARGLEAVEIAVLGALSQGQIARALRTAFDPYGRAELAALETVDSDRDGLSAANAWPLGAEESWEHYRSDGAYHATYWIAAWPRVEVSPMFMDAMLSGSSIARTVAVSFEPLAPDRSTREAEAAVTRDRADRELRSRFGQSETARLRQAQEAAARREAELAAGHSEVRFAGFVTVTGRDPDELRRGCAVVLEQAARARLELHRMYGRQADAFTFTLPLARGLR
jgi:hypothetical protein